MKKLKTGMFALAFLLTASAIFAFKTTEDKKQPATSYFFELKPGGNKMVRADWIPASDDPSCPTTHSEEPCRLILTTNGANPSAIEFSEVLSGSDDFEQEYSKVTYRP